MRNASKRPATNYASMTELSVPNQNEWESWSIRILLFVLVLDGLIPLLLPGFATHLRIQIGSVPQVLIGFTILALVFYLQVELQRKSLRQVGAGFFHRSADPVIQPEIPRPAVQSAIEMAEP
jgi:uncharacterized protein YjeT (DUF2065 family)